jgi:Ser/Thr protein kinase RdoA (MazF antagonist)
MEPSARMPESPKRTHGSILDSAFLSRRIAARWGWQQPGCEYWSGDLNDTYRVSAKRRRAYLRVYRQGWRSRAEIQGEVELLRFLGRRGAAVSCPLEKSDGSFIDPIEAPEGRRYAVLFSEAQGSTPGMDRNNSRIYGQLAAKIHRLADSHRGRFQRPELDLHHLAWNPLDHIRGFLAHRPRDVAYLSRVAADLAEAVVSLLPVTGPQYGLCHGDLHFHNVHKDGDGRLTLFDFDCSGYGWRAYDVAVFRWSRGWELNRSANLDRARQWNGFLDGYHAVRRLSDAELAAVDLFVPLRHVWLMGLHARMLPVLGRRRLSESHVDRQIAFIRNWLRVYKPL